MKLQESKTGQMTITIPSMICSLKGWKKGTQLFLITNDKGELILKERPRN